jgi:hypothetical protein
MSRTHITPGAPYVYDVIYTWEALPPWGAQSTVGHKLIRCAIDHTMFTAAAQTETIRVYNVPIGKATMVRDAWWYGVESWDDGALKGLKISVGLEADNVALLQQIDSSDTGASTFFGDAILDKGTLLASPSTPLVLNGKNGVSVTLDAGVGNVVADATHGESFLYLQIVEFDVT